jgi:D-serine dehydratase
LIIRPEADPHATLSSLDKGVPVGIEALPLSQVASQGWNLLREDLPLPVAVLKARSLAHNSAWMKRFIEGRRVAIAPHGKTTMAPGLFDLQMRDGAWGITLSTPHQINVALAMGYRRIFIANQIVGRAGIRQLFEAIGSDPRLELYCLADSIALVSQIERVAAESPGHPALNILVEKGFDGGRTGCRTVAEAVAVARAIAASPHLRLAGVEGFEGIIRKEAPEATLAALTAFLDSVVAVAEICDAERLFSGPILLSAGGSAFFDLVVEAFEAASLSVPVTILLRSGCYITHDSGMYTHAFRYLRDRAPKLFEEGGLEPALEVWGYVQSRPEPGRAIIGVGKRDVSYDDMPVPLYWFRPGWTAPEAMPEGHRMVRLNDQHGYLDLPPGSPLEVGDMIGLGISHPCLTFDKWRVMHLVDADYDIVASIRTYF